MTTIKYYWPERKKGALAALTRSLERADENIEQSKKDVSEASLRLEEAHVRLRRHMEQRDECLLAIVAVRKFEAEDMYHESLPV